MRFLCVIMAVFFVSMSAVADYRLMIFGDSLSAGYKLPVKDAFYTKLEQALHKQGYTNVYVLNESKSGETTAGGLRRLSSALAKKPDAILLELGANDMLKGGSVNTARDNLQKMIDEIEQHNIPVMLIGMELPSVFKPALGRAFANMYTDLSKKNGLILYPHFMKDVLVVNPRTWMVDKTYILSDGVHPNKDGVDIMVKNVLPSVIKFLDENGVHR